MMKRILMVAATLLSTFVVSGAALADGIGEPVHFATPSSNAVASTPTCAASCPSSPANSPDPIIRGLWAGANFDFSSLGLDTPDQSTPTTPVPATPSGGRYAALGDSVAAGLGLPLQSNDPSDVQCGRSSQAYAHEVSRRTGLPLTFAACSGATAGDLFTHQGVPGPNIEPQLDTAFADGTPALITITAGANDAHWQDFLRYCYSSDCTTGPSSFTADALLASLRVKLHTAFNDIAWRSNGSPPRVIITGYYNPLSSRCTTESGNQITASELAWFDQEVSALNQTIREVAADYSFVTYTPVDFSGHELCTTTPWVQGLNEPAPFHPTAAGQRQIARSVIQAY